MILIRISLSVLVSGCGFACWRVTYFCMPKNKSPTKRAPRSVTLRVPCDARQMAALRNSSLRSSDSPRLSRHFAALLGAFEGEFSTAQNSGNLAFKIQCFIPKYGTTLRLLRNDEQRRKYMNRSRDCLSPKLATILGEFRSDPYFSSSAVNPTGAMRRGALGVVRGLGHASPLTRR